MYNYTLYEKILKYTSLFCDNFRDLAARNVLLSEDLCAKVRLGLALRLASSPYIVFFIGPTSPFPPPSRKKREN